MAERGQSTNEAWQGEMFRLLAENVLDYAVFILGPQRHVLSWSKGAERLLGFAEEEIVGRPCDLFFTPEDRQNGVPRQELEQALATGRGEDDRWHVRKDGSRFWCSGVVTPLRDDDGGVRAFAKIMRDLTQKKQLEDALRGRADDLADAARKKDEFLAMLSHELRNPLAPILNSLHIMQQVVSDSPVLQQVRATIERQVQQMARLVDDLLDVSRITQGKLELRRERVELRAVVDRAVEAVRPLVETHRHELTVSLPAAPVWLEADPARLGQVLTNLLNNAAKYTESGGRIALEASHQGDAVVLRVRDNGVGIAPDMLPRVFDLFAQADRSQARSQGGLGVGLTLVKRLVEMHGGTVEAASAGLGRGSEFTVRLPVLMSVAVGGTEEVETYPFCEVAARPTYASEGVAGDDGQPDPEFGDLRVGGPDDGADHRWVFAEFALLHDGNRTGGEWLREVEADADKLRRLGWKRSAFVLANPIRVRTTLPIVHQGTTVAVFVWWDRVSA